MIELRRRYSGGKGSDSPSFSRLPKGYQEVEYLENTGGAYLVLSIKPQIGDAVKVKFRDALKNNNTSVCAIIGSERFGFGIDNSYKIYGNSAYQFTSHVYNGKINTVLYEWKESTFALTVLDDDLTKLGSFEYPRSSTYTEININLPIFTAYYSGYNSSFNMAGNVYIYEYYRDGELFANLVPCYRISDHKPGMYDIVNDVFYINAGTGEFLVGPDVHYSIPFEYQQVEYLGTQGDGAYIKTNVLYDSTQDDYEIECKYLIIQRTNFAHIFGASEGGNYNSIILAQLDIDNGYLAFFNKSTISIHYKFQHKYGHSIGTICKFSVSNITMSDTENNSPITVTEISQGANGIESINKVTFCLFSADQSLTPSLYMKAYAYIIRKGNLTLCNLIPCYRKADNVAGMYDIVNGVFYTNAGTGEFIVGPNVIG